MSYKHKSDIGHIIRGSDSLIADKKIAPVFEELDEVYRKAEAFNRLYAEFDKGDKDLSKADFDAVYKEDSQ